MSRLGLLGERCVPCGVDHGLGREHDTGRCIRVRPGQVGAHRLVHAVRLGAMTDALAHPDRRAEWDALRDAHLRPRAPRLDFEQACEIL